MENVTYFLHRLLGSVENAVAFGLFILLSYMVIVPIHRLYFHPLSKYPGPRLWAISRIPFAYYYINGTSHAALEKLHAKYGDTVRTAPNELSFINGDAWDDIYRADKITRQQLARDPQLVLPPPDGGAHSIIFTPNEDDHARMRRNFNPMFSDSAMRAQEPMMKGYFDLLIQRLHENCSKPINVCHWFNYTTFDVIGDLTYGESFGCLEKSELHFWVKNLFEWIKGGLGMGMAQKLYPLDKILGFLVMSKRQKAKIAEHEEYNAAKLARRLERKDGRQDFLSHVQKNFGTSVGMSMAELKETMGIIIMAGSETSATSLVSQVYFLCRNPSALQKLQHEIRTRFKHEDDINILAVSQLPYILGVINESLRLFPPATPTSSTNRITPPEGTTVLGEHVPGGTIVSVTQYTSFRSPLNFRDPEDFVPERWLPEGQERYGSDKKNALQPFGMGPRICLGKSLAYAEMKMILARVIWNFDFELADKGYEWTLDQKAYGVWEKPDLMVNFRPVVRD